MSLMEIVQSARFPYDVRKSRTVRDFLIHSTSIAVLQYRTYDTIIYHAISVQHHNVPNMWSIVQYNRDLRNIDNYNNVACNLINTLSDYCIEASLAVSKVNVAAVQFAKFVYQYYVCTDDNDKPIPVPDHVYNKTTGELDFMFFLSITKVSYKHTRTSNITKSLNKKLTKFMHIIKNIILIKYHR